MKTVVMVSSKKYGQVKVTCWYDKESHRTLVLAAESKSGTPLRIGNITDACRDYIEAEVKARYLDAMLMRSRLYADRAKRAGARWK